jgi:hypothetical protein
MTVKDFQFQLATTTNDNANIDGILGMSFAENTGVKTFWEAALDAKLANSSVVSYFIDDTEKTGGITFGGVDLARFNGPMTWTPVEARPFARVGNNFFMARMNSIMVEGTSVPLPADLFAIADTGSSLGFFPADTAKRINEELGLTVIQTGVYGIRCQNGEIPSDRKTLTLTVGGIALKFTAKDYLFLVNDPNGLFCVSGVFGSFNGKESAFSSVILGNVLLRKFYVAFDYKNKQMGFAACNRSPTVKSEFLAADSSVSFSGTADPSSIRSDGVKRKSNSSRLEPSQLSLILSLFGLISFVWLPLY